MELVKIIAMKIKGLDKEQLAEVVGRRVSNNEFGFYLGKPKRIHISVNSFWFFFDSKSETEKIIS